MINNNGTYEMFSDYSDVVNVTDLQEMLNIGRNKAYQLINENQIKSVRIGKVHKIPKKWVIEYLENLVN